MWRKKREAEGHFFVYHVTLFSKKRRKKRFSRSAFAKIFDGRSYVYRGTLFTPVMDIIISWYSKIWYFLQYFDDWPSESVNIICILNLNKNKIYKTLKKNVLIKSIIYRILFYIFLILIFHQMINLLLIIYMIQLEFVTLKIKINYNWILWW